MVLTTSILLSGGLGLAGCGKKPPPSGSAAGSASSVGKATPRQYVVGGKIDLQALTATLHEYVMWKKQIPADLNELVESGFLPSLPEAPPGQRLAVKRGAMRYEVVLVNQ
jgi:ABC-type glycerol-3-phosphate transport system substrate-binding protein